MNLISFVVTFLKSNWIPSVFYLDIYSFLYIWKAFCYICYIFKVLLSLFLYKGNRPRFWGKPAIWQGRLGDSCHRYWLGPHRGLLSTEFTEAAPALRAKVKLGSWLFFFFLLPLAGRYLSPCCIAWGKRLFKVALCQPQCIFSYFLASSRCWGSPLTWH